VRSGTVRKNEQHIERRYHPQRQTDTLSLPFLTLDLNKVLNISPSDFEHWNTCILTPGHLLCGKRIKRFPQSRTQTSWSLKYGIPCTVAGYIGLFCSSSFPLPPSLSDFAFKLFKFGPFHALRLRSVLSTLRLIF